MLDLKLPTSLKSEVEAETDRGPLVLLLFDSWGIAPLSSGNVLTDLKLKTLAGFLENYPVATLSASGEPGERYRTLGAQGRLTTLIAEAGLKQYRLSESEATPFLEAYFLNGRTGLLKGEKREIVSSLAGDRQENLDEVSDILVKKLINVIKKGEGDFIVISLSNLDLATRNGNLEQAKMALETFDLYLEKIADLVRKYHGILILSSVYGRAEDLVNPASGLIQTGISDNPVPFLIIGKNYVGQSLGADVLSADLSLLSPVANLSAVAPTILQLLNIKIPRGFPGKSLL